MFTRVCSLFDNVKNYLTNISEAVSLLEQGKIMLYPTDTIYGIGCDATNEEAIDKVFAIKNRPKEKSLIVLVSDIRMLKEYVTINEDTEKLILSFTEPTTVIYSNPVNLAKNAVNSVNTIAIRIPKQEFCQKLIKEFGKPIISTSANISTENSPLSFEDISDEIRTRVDFIIDKQFDTSTHKTPSRLIKIHPDNSIEYLR